MVSACILIVVRLTCAWRFRLMMSPRALVHRSDYNGEVLAACKTHRTRAMVKRQDGDAIEPAWFYGVTSVIAPKKHRGEQLAWASYGTSK